MLRKENCHLLSVRNMATYQVLNKLCGIMAWKFHEKHKNLVKIVLSTWQTASLSFFSWLKCNLFFFSLFFSFILFFYHIIFIIFFPLPFSPLIPPSPQQSPLCCLRPWVLFPFCSIPPYPKFPTPPSCHLLSIYESISVLLVSSVCLLDSKYEWNHMVFVFLWLAYFT